MFVGVPLAAVERAASAWFAARQQELLETVGDHAHQRLREVMAELDPAMFTRRTLERRGRELIALRDRPAAIVAWQQAVRHELAVPVAVFRCDRDAVWAVGVPDAAETGGSGGTGAVAGEPATDATGAAVIVQARWSPDAGSALSRESRAPPDPPPPGAGFAHGLATRVAAVTATDTAVAIAGLWQVLRETDPIRQDLVWSRVWLALRASLGIPLQFDTVTASRLRAVPVRGGRTERWCWWASDPDDRDRGLLVLVFASPSLDVLQARLVRRWMAPDSEPASAGSVLAIRDLDTEQVVTVGDGPAGGLLAGVWRRLRIHRARSEIDAGRAFALAQLGDREVLLGVVDPRPRQLSDWQRRVGWALLLTGLLGLAGTWLWQVGGWRPYLSLRVKLPLVFAWAILVPLVGGAAIASLAGGDHSRVEAVVRQQQLRDAAIAFDRDFMGECGEFLRAARELRAELAAGRTAAAIQAAVDRWTAMGFAVGVDVRDLDGNCLGRSRGVRELWFDRLLRVYAQLAAEIHLGARMTAHEGGGRPAAADLMARSVLESGQTGFDEVLHAPGGLHSVRTGRLEAFWYWDVVREPGRLAATIIINQSADLLRRQYLKRTLSAANSDGELRLAVFDSRTARWFPASIDAGEDLVAFAERVGRTREPQVQRLLVDGRPTLAVGVAGRQLDGFQVIALSPLAGSDGWVPGGTWGSAFWIVLACSLLAAPAAGAMVADALLVPIAALAAGLRAWQRHDLGWQVPVAGDDELSGLCLAFNRMMEGRRELEQAGRVRAAILSASLRPRPGWIVAGCPNGAIAEAARDNDDWWRASARSADAGGGAGRGRLGGGLLHHEWLDSDRLAVAAVATTRRGLAGTLLIAMAKGILLDAAGSAWQPGGILRRWRRALTPMLGGAHRFAGVAVIIEPGAVSGASLGAALSSLVTPAGDWCPTAGSRAGSGRERPDGSAAGAARRPPPARRARPARGAKRPFGAVQRGRPAIIEWRCRLAGQALLVGGSPRRHRRLARLLVRSGHGDVGIGGDPGVRHDAGASVRDRCRQGPEAAPGSAGSWPVAPGHETQTECSYHRGWNETLLTRCLTGEDAVAGGGGFILVVPPPKARHD